MALEEADELLDDATLLDGGDGVEPQEEDLKLILKDLARTERSRGTLDIPGYLASLHEYPVLGKEGFVTLHVTYRKLVEHLHRLRLSGHIDPEHCESCVAAKHRYFDTKAALKSTDKTDSKEELQRRHEAAKELVLEQRRQGHVKPQHCKECRGVKRALSRLVDQVTYGSRLLVLYAVRKYWHRGVEALDLLQEGMSHVGRVFAQYNPYRTQMSLPVILMTDKLGQEQWIIPPQYTTDDGTRTVATFTSLLVYALKRRFDHVIANTTHKRVTRIPAWLHQKCALIGAIEAKMQGASGIRPSDEKLLEAIHALSTKTAKGLTLRDIKTYREAPGVGISLDGPGSRASENGSGTVRTLGEITPDRSVMDLETRGEIIQLMGFLKRIFHRMREASRSLHPSIAFVVLNRLGLDNRPKAYTLQELGDQLGCTRERIRQLQVEGLERMQCLTGIKPDEVEPMLMAYAGLRQLLPDYEDNGPSGYRLPSVELDEFLAVYKEMTLEALIERYAHLISTPSPLLKPYELNASDRRNYERETRSLAMTASSLLQIRLLLQFVHTANGRRYVNRPGTYLSQEAYLLPTEASYVLHNLVLRGWISRVPSDDEGSGRFDCIEIHWQEGWPVDPPDRPVVIAERIPMQQKAEPVVRPVTVAVHVTSVPTDQEQTLSRQLCVTQTELEATERAMRELEQRLRQLRTEAGAFKAQIAQLKALHTRILAVETEIRAALNDG